MQLTEVIEGFFPKGVSRALIEIEQSHDGFDENPTRVLWVHGQIYVGGTEPRNQVIGSHGAIKVDDIPDITRISVAKMAIEGVVFEFDNSVLIDPYEDEYRNEVMYYVLNYWEEYTKTLRYRPSQLHTKLKWVTTLERSA